MLEHRIATLEERLRAARVLEKKDIAKGVVSVGSVVRLKDMAANKTFEYTIVGSAEEPGRRASSPTSRPSARPSSAARRARSSRSPRPAAR